MVLETKTCQHYWLIEPACGITSKGQCIYCHKKQTFTNIIPTDNIQIAPHRTTLDDLGYLTYQGATYKEK